MLTTFEQFKTYYNALIQKVKGFKGNWNQNDPAADDYIKNRTHYSEIKETVFVKEQTISGFFMMQDPIYAVQNPFSFTPVIGDTYTIMWDGESYDCTVYDGNGLVYLGNENYVDMMSGGDIPFAIVWAGDIFVVTESTVDSHTISIFNRNEIIHKIDEKYLPKISSVGAEGTGSNAEIFNDYKNNKAQGPYSHAEGCQTMAGGEGSHAEGNRSTANGQFSHAEGYSTEANGQYSHAEGSGTNAEGMCSHAEGDNTYANGICSHAEGYITYANGDYSHVEGYTTHADGNASHAEGYETYAIGPYSHAEGYETKASGDFQHVQGKYNIEDTENKYAHIVGNGKGWSARSNAHTIDWNGNAWFAGNVTIGTNEERLVTEKDINVILNSTDILVSNIHMVDQVNGKTYVVQMRNGNLVSTCIPEISIKRNPTKMTYYDGDCSIDTTGMVLEVAYEDGTVKEVTEGIISFVENALSANNKTVSIEYTENGITSSTILDVTVNEFDPAVVLADFNYADNGDGTYTINSWNQTLNGVASTECIIPNNNRIIL